MTTTIQKQNIRAAGVTLLILSSCLLCWIPVSVTHLLICPQDCLYHHTDLDPLLGFSLHAIINLLLISKSVLNPVIFALR